MKKSLIITQALALCLIGFNSCSKGNEDGIIDPPPPPPFSLDASKMSGEWISRSAANNYNKMSMLSSGEFDETEVTRGWAIASVNEKGRWSVSDKTIIMGSYKKKNSAEDNVGQDVSVRLEVSTQNDYSFVAKNSTGENTYKKLLGEMKLRKGQTVVPECLPERQHTEIKKIVTPFQTKYTSITSDVITGFISDDVAVATVDNTTGAITATGSGVTFVNVLTADQGVATIKVLVDDDFAGLIGKTREEIHNIYGTSNILADNIAQTMYNMEGDFKSIKMVYQKGVVDYVIAFLSNNADITKYKEFISNGRYLVNEKENYWAYNDKPTFEETSYQIQINLNEQKHLGYFKNHNSPYKILFDDYSMAMDKSKEDLLKIYGKPYINRPEGIGYILPNAFNTYVDKVAFSINNDICNLVTVYLQPNVNKEEVMTYLAQYMELLGHIIDAPETFVYKHKDSQIETQYDTKTNTINHWYPQPSPTKASNFTYTK